MSAIHRSSTSALGAISLVALVLAGCAGSAAAPEPDEDAPTPAALESPAVLESPALAASPSEVGATTAPSAGTAAAPTAAALAVAPALGVAPTPGSGAGLESPRPAPPLEGLINADGTPFSLADHAGSPVLVFFGYTHCPDVCPTTIGELFGVFQAAPEAQAVFVSVDPERDTPEWLAKWTEYFPENFHGVTGSPGAVRRAADGYGVKYARVETSSKAGYTMSHSADVYLIDGEGQLRMTYPFGTPAAEMAAGISALRSG